VVKASRLGSIAQNPHPIADIQDIDQSFAE